MKPTADQWTEVERQRRENPGGRIVIEPTPEQSEEYRRAVEVEEAGREANISYARRVLAAAREPGFSGDLRRAYGAARRMPDDVAREVGVDVEVLANFLAGDASLPSDAIEQLVAVLRLKLVPQTQS